MPDNWQDIATALMTWEDVLVFSPEHEGFNCGGVFVAFRDPEFGWGSYQPGGVMSLNPTAWQPLPSPPTDPKEPS